MIVYGILEKDRDGSGTFLYTILIHNLSRNAKTSLAKKTSSCSWYKQQCCLLCIMHCRVQTTLTKWM